MPFGPANLAEAKKFHYRHTYGRRQGASDYTPGRCIARVSDSFTRAPSYYQCSRQAIAGPDKAWCKQHDPDRLNQKADAEKAKRVAREKEQEDTRNRGEKLTARLVSMGFDGASVHYHSGVRFQDSGYQPLLCVPFEVIEELLKP